MSTDNFNRQFQIKSGLSDKSINKKVEHKLEEEKDSTWNKLWIFSLKSNLLPKIM